MEWKGFSGVKKTKGNVYGGMRKNVAFEERTVSSTVIKLKIRCTETWVSHNSAGDTKQNLTVFFFPPCRQP